MKRWLGLDSFFLFFLRKLLFIWVRTHRLPQDFATLGIDPSRPIVYALQDKDLSNLLVVEHECVKLGLPKPTTLSRIRGTGSDRRFFCLTRSDSLLFGRHRTPYISARIERLLAAGLKDEKLEVQIVPVSVYWGRHPEREKSWLRLMLSDDWSATGMIKKMFMILVNGRQTYVQFSTPVSLRELLAQTPEEERGSRKLGRVLRVHFRREREAMIGPDLSHRRTLLDTLISAPAVREAIERETREKNSTLEEATEAAWEYANEIASDYSHNMIQFLAMVLNWLWNRLYAGVEVKNVEQLANLAKTHELVYTPCHRSHIDYLLLSYVIYRHGMVPPHVAAGINLNMPVLGTVLRRGGAFFMRRSFKGNPLYATVFYEYLHTMFARGFSIEYFMEGGRSRTGRQLQPRTGMLAMTVRSFLRDTGKPIAFVPVYIGYERILESGSYVEELHGKQKKKESLGGFFETVGRLFARTEKLSDRFGKVYVNFGEPLDLGEFLDGYTPGWREKGFSEDATRDWLPPVVDKLARRLSRRINAAAAVNPVALVSLVLLSTSKRVMDEDALTNQLALYQRLLNAVPYAPTVSLCTMSAEEMIAHCEKMQVLQRHKHTLGDLLWLDDAASVTGTYYRNNILHLFALPSLIANLVLQNRQVTREQLIALAALVNLPLRAELFLAHGQHSVAERISLIADALLAEGLIEQGEKGELIAPHTNTLNYARLHTLAQAIRETLERYYIVVSLLTSHDSGTFNEEQLEALSQQVAQRTAILYMFNSPEFFDAQVIRRFIRTLKREGLLGTDENGHITYTDMLRQIEADTRRILAAEVRQNIGRHTRIDLATLPTPEPAKKKRK